MRLPLSHLRQNAHYKGNIFSVLNNKSVLNIDRQSNLTQRKRKRKRKKRTKYLVSRKHSSTIFRTGVNINIDRKKCRSMESDQTHCVKSNKVSSRSSQCKVAKFSQDWLSRGTHVSHTDRPGLNVYTVHASCGGSNISDASTDSFSKLLNTQVKHKVRKASASMNFFKLKKIEHWVKTGNYGLNSEPEALGLLKANHPQCVNLAELDCSEDLEIKGHVKLTSFLPNFTSAYVIQINVAGHVTTALIDCGASKTLATSTYIKECLGQQYELLLVRYEGPQFHAASGENLNIQGVLHCTLQCGSLVWKEPIIVYTAPHSELLIGHSVLTLFSLLISPKALYIPTGVLQTHIATQKCCRLGTLATPILLLQCVKGHTLSPMESVSIPCFVSTKHYDEEITSNLEQYSWIAHTEEMQATTDMKELFVFYQLIEFKGNQTEIHFTNTTQEYIYLTKNEMADICHPKK